MRIGIDCLPLQTQTGRLRGIGRYSRDLVRAMITEAPAVEWVCYLQQGLSLAHVPTNCELVSFPGPQHRSLATSTIGPALEGNPHGLDAFLTLSPHEQFLDARHGIPLLASVAYDLVPDRAREAHQAIPGYWEGYERYLEGLRKYDRLLAISYATAADFVALRGFDQGAIAVISSGYDRELFRPGPGLEPARARQLGITKPYVLHVGGEDPRKGGDELLAAFAGLPMRLRSTLQLVYTYSQSSSHAFRLKKAADQQHRLGPAFVLTGFVDDATLAALYRGAVLMALPSKGEGFGLPLLEAMACAVPVLAGDNTSQPEVAGAGGLCVDTANVGAIGKGLETLLGNRQRYADAAARQAAKFSWEGTARAALKALGVELPKRSVVSVGGCMPVWTRAEQELWRLTAGLPSGRPPLALFGPVPPVLSGITPYTMELGAALSGHYTVTVYHDPEVRPEIPEDYPCEVLPATRFKGETRSIAQFGNSHYHAFLVPYRDKFLVSTIHDLNLAGLWSWLRRRQWTSSSSPEELLRQVARDARRVVVHSRFNVDQGLPREFVGKVAVVPFGCRPLDISAEERRTIRARYRIPNDRKVIISGGILHETKLPAEVLLAFAVCRQVIEGWCVVFAGLEADGGATQELRKRLRLSNGQVYFTGAITTEEFPGVMACADLALNLRRPPTNGETSASLMDALRSGVPAIVSDVGTFACYPDTCVRKVKPGDFPGLVAALLELAGDEAARRRLGAAGRELVEREHSWGAVAARYAELVEAAVAEGVRAAG